MPRTAASRRPNEGGQGSRTGDQKGPARQVEFTRAKQHPEEDQPHPEGRGRQGARPIQRVPRKQAQRRIKEDDDVVEGRGGARNQSLRPILHRKMVLNQSLSAKDPLDARQLGVAIGFYRPGPHGRRVLCRIRQHPLGRIDGP
jgi:hypothetical protein